MNCWPSDSVSFTARSLASGSTDPPGGNGTTNLTGFVGQAWACDAAGRIATTPATTSPAKAARQRVLRVIASSGTCQKGAEAYHPPTALAEIRRGPRLACELQDVETGVRAVDDIDVAAVVD